MTAFWTAIGFMVGIVAGPTAIFAVEGLGPYATPFLAFLCGILSALVFTLILGDSRPLWWVKQRALHGQRKVLIDLATQVDRGALSAKTIRPALACIRHAERLRRRAITIRFDDKPKELYLLDLSPIKVPAKSKDTR